MSNDVSTDPATAPLTETGLNAFAVAWYQALDRHDSFEVVQNYVVHDELVMVFPETTTNGLSGFEIWYGLVTNKFFDEIHEVTGTEITNLTPERATVTVSVHWQASKWEAPAPLSERLDFNAVQTWDVVPGPNGPRIKRYVVDLFEPNPGSAAL